jgi:RNA polymerase sigma-70 factor (ECF subfamily)
MDPAAFWNFDTVLAIYSPRGENEFGRKSMPSKPITSSTCLSLLGRVRQQPADQAAWSQVAHRYGRMIQNWCRRWGLGPHDAEDLSQKVLLELSQQMASFQYDAQGSFRAWLKTIAYRTWCDHLERRRRDEQGTGDSAVLQMLNSTEARDNFMRQLEEEWNRELLAEAMRIVKARVQDHTWDAFRLMSQEALSGQEVAERLNMKVGAVWVAKSKVQKMIAEEIRELEDLEATGPR